MLSCLPIASNSEIMADGFLKEGKSIFMALIVIGGKIRAFKMRRLSVSVFALSFLMRWLIAQIT